MRNVLLYIFAFASSTLVRNSSKSMISTLTFDYYSKFLILFINLRLSNDNDNRKLRLSKYNAVASSSFLLSSSLAISNKRCDFAMFGLFRSFVKYLTISKDRSKHFLNNFTYSNFFFSFVSISSSLSQNSPEN